MTVSEMENPNLVRPGFFSVLKLPAFLTLWLSEMISLIGDRLLLVVLINLVYEHTASASAVSVLSLLKALPALVLGGLAGVFVDRWSRKWIMVFSNLLLAGMVLLFPFINSLIYIYLIYFIMAIISQFFVPARSAAIPALVPDAALMAANSLFAAAFVGAITIGPAIGGWITTSFGPQTAFWIDALTFLVPATAVAFLVIPQTKRPEQERDFKADWKEGFQFIRSRCEMRNALILMGAAGLLISGLSVLGIMVVREKLGGSAADFGWMMSVAGLGMLVGALLAPRLAQRLNRQRMAAWGALLAGMSIGILALSPALIAVMICAFPLGLGIVTVQVNTQTTLQTAPDALRGRVLGFGQTVMGTVTFAGAGLVGLLAGWLGVSPVLLGSGLLTAAFSLFLLTVAFPKQNNQSIQTPQNGG
jgi:MFS family permease